MAACPSRLRAPIQRLIVPVVGTRLPSSWARGDLNSRRTRDGRCSLLTDSVDEQVLHGFVGLADDVD
jgi:hypothetical protein